MSVPPGSTTTAALDGAKLPVFTRPELRRQGGSRSGRAGTGGGGDKGAVVGTELEARTGAGVAAGAAGMRWGVGPSGLLPTPPVPTPLTGAVDSCPLCLLCCAQVFCFGVLWLFVVVFGGGGGGRGAEYLAWRAACRRCAPPYGSECSSSRLCTPVAHGSWLLLAQGFKRQRQQRGRQRQRPAKPR